MPIVLPQRLTYQIGEQQVVDLLSHPSNRSKRNDHGHEVLNNENNKNLSTPRKRLGSLTVGCCFKGWKIIQYLLPLFFKETWYLYIT